MNWRRLLLNLAGSAAAGFATAVSAAPAGAPSSGRALAAAAGAAALVNVVGLFQEKPHADPK